MRVIAQQPVKPTFAAYPGFTPEGARRYALVDGTLSPCNLQPGCISIYHWMAGEYLAGEYLAGEYLAGACKGQQCRSQDQLVSPTCPVLGFTPEQVFAPKRQGAFPALGFPVSSGLPTHGQPDFWKQSPLS